MTKTPGSPNREETIRAWAEIVIKIWRDKLTEMQIWDTGQLYDSFKYNLMVSAGDNVEKIEFAFELYGYFVDMGVGKEVNVGNKGSVDTSRERKEWYSRVFYTQVLRLREILQERFGEEVAHGVVTAMRPVKDLKYAQALSKRKV